MFQIKNAEFIKSAAGFGGYADISAPVIAVAGKSNVGKSSFINMLTGNGKLAKVSKEAGRTRLINLFSINNGEFILADLPGWGYSAAGKDRTAGFSAMIEEFLNKAPGLKHIIMLVDIRHEPQDTDRQMLRFMHYYQIPFTVAAVKCDKLSGARLGPQRDIAARGLAIGRDDVIPVSNLDKTGKDAVLKKIGGILNSSNEDIKS